MKNIHMILMLLPILLLVFLPIFGFSQDNVFVLAIVLMFGLHFLMMGSHGHEHQTNHRNHNEIKNSDSLMESNNTTNNANQDLHQKTQKR